MEAGSNALTAVPQPGNSLVARMASRFGVDPNKMLATLKSTAFKGEVTNEQMMSLLVVAEQYGLNPWTREIYAFPDKGGIVPVVGVDGWARIINTHPQYNGLHFTDGPYNKEGMPEWIECTIFRKDRDNPTTVREYMTECRRGSPPWSSHPRRMLRHKSLIQCARVAMGFAGIYDEDEAHRIIEGDSYAMPTVAAVDSLNAEITTGSALKLGAVAGVVLDEPVSVVTDARPFTFAELSQMIRDAKTESDLMGCAQLAQALPDDRQRAEVDVEMRARRKAMQQ